MKITTSVALTLATTTALGDTFADVHKAAEHLLGHPIWTHEFADKGLWNRMRSEILRQHPGLVDFSPSKENWEQVLQEAVTALGSSLEITKGEDVRAEDPLESLQRIAPDKPVIGVILPEGEE